MEVKSGIIPSDLAVVVRNRRNCITQIKKTLSHLQRLQNLSLNGSTAHNYNLISSSFQNTKREFLTFR